MKPSPLQLESYVFTRIHMDACEDPECLEMESAGQVQVNTQCQQHNEEPSRWMVTIRVSVSQKDAEPCPPYVLDVEVVGFFQVAEEYPPEKRASMVKANAPAVLFGAVREMVSNITARGPYPRVDFPTVTFIDEAQARPEPSVEKKKEKGTSPIISSF